MRESGVTLLELMLVLAITVILLTIGLPSFASLLGNSRLTAATNELLASILLARSEAIKRNARTVLCVSTDGKSCAVGGGWHQGWLVFHDADNDAAHDAGETVILVRPALPRGVIATGNTHVARYVSYASTGGSKLVSGAWQAGTLTLCSQYGTVQAARQIIISSTGRPRTIMLEACP